jgi:hypothetical protein
VAWLDFDEINYKLHEEPRWDDDAASISKDAMHFPICSTMSNTC